MAKINPKGGEVYRFQIPLWHRGQMAVYAHKRRQNFICAHRGWRKSSMQIWMMFDWLMTGQDMGWYAPTSKTHLNNWREIYKCLKHIPNYENWFNHTDYTFSIPGHGTCYFFSLENPDNARGFTFGLGLGDEMGEWADGVYESVVWPIMKKAAGTFWGFGTPNTVMPQNDFYNRLEHAKRHPDSMASYIIPYLNARYVDGDLVPGTDQTYTMDFPFANFDELREDFHQTMPHMRAKWRIEYLCEFIADAGGQFDGIDECCRLMPVQVGDRYWKPNLLTGNEAGAWYQAGVDVGIVHDFTVSSVINRSTMEHVYMRRFLPQGQSKWAQVEKEIEYIANRFQCNPIVDVTGAGSHLPESMLAHGVMVDPFKFSVATKQPLLDHLSSLVGSNKCVLMNIPELKNELKLMQRKARSTGGFSIEAPKGNGSYDDIPISLALAFRGVTPPTVELGNWSTTEKISAELLDMIAATRINLDHW